VDILQTLRALGPGYKLVSAAVDEIERLRARIAELETANKKLQDRVSEMEMNAEMEMNDLARLGQEIDAKLTPEDQQAIQRALRRSVDIVAKQPRSC
jgi:hypothetical protein